MGLKPGVPQHSEENIISDAQAVPALMLTTQEEVFVTNYLAHGNAALAAKEAGFPSVTALLRNPRIREQIDIRREKVRKTHGYTADSAMREAYSAMRFAKRCENPNAYVKAVELRARIMGLLVDKVDHRILGNFSIQITGIDGHPAAKPLEELPPSVKEKVIEAATKAVDELGVYDKGLREPDEQGSVPT